MIIKDNKFFKLILKYKIPLIISFVLGIIIYISPSDYSQQYNKVSNEILATQTKIEDLKSNNNTDQINKQISELKDENSNLNNEINDKTAKINEIKSQKLAEEKKQKEEQERLAKEQANQNQTKESRQNTNENIQSENRQSTTVYITPTGKKYHLNPKCGHTKSSRPISIEEAQQRGYGACKKCC